MASASTHLYKHPRFPGEIISPAGWLSSRFSLSHRDGEERLLVRGVVVSYEALRKGWRKFGQQCAHQLCRRRSRPGAKGPWDEMLLTIHGERHSLWRAVDQDGNVLDILGQRWRDTKAAQKCFRTLLTGCQYVPRGLLTDNLKS